MSRGRQNNRVVDAVACPARMTARHYMKACSSPGRVCRRRPDEDGVTREVMAGASVASTLHQSISILAMAARHDSLAGQCALRGSGYNSSAVTRIGVACNQAVYSTGGVAKLKSCSSNTTAEKKSNRGSMKTATSMLPQRLTAARKPEAKNLPLLYSKKAATRA